MRNEGKIQLLQKYYSGIITDEELKSLFVWLNSKEGNHEYEELVNNKWLSGEFKMVKNIDSSILFSRIEEKMQKKIHFGRRQFLIRLRNAAAIFLLGFLIPLAYFNFLKPQKNNSQIGYISESLSNEKVKRLILPDGTAVWLMAGSTISYPSSFSESKTRNVKVNGQAFFNVAKDASHPFILDLGKIGLKVLGTSFNVMNYSDEDHINVALKTGNIELFEGKYELHKKVTKMVPGELVTYNRANADFYAVKTNVEKYTSWIDGILQFRDDPLPEVLTDLGRWYNVVIEIKNPKVSNFPFTTTIRNENLEQVVELLRFSTPFAYSIVKKDSMTQLIIQ